MIRTIIFELRAHAPFTAVGTSTGIALMVLMVHLPHWQRLSAHVFWTLHPFHVLLSALATAGIYRRHGRRGIWRTALIGYSGSVGIATLSDCLLPYLGEALLGLPNRGLHLGVIEKWWIVNPLAAAGIALALLRPRTKLPHAGHVLLSTWASLFHVMMAAGTGFTATTLLVVGPVLFLAVWLPCCTSDIVFPLLCSREREAGMVPRGRGERSGEATVASPRERKSRSRI